MFRFTQNLGFLLALAAMALARGDPAQADITYSLTTGNPAISGYTGPYGTVTVHLSDSTDATITFTSSAVPGSPINGNDYLFGDSRVVDVNVNAASWTVGNFSESNTGTGFSTSGSNLSNGGSGTVDDLGVFNQTFTNADGFKDSATQISFTVTNTGGTWASANNVLTPNAGGSTVAAHIYVTSDPANASNGALATGYAGNGSELPEPASLALWGLAGLVGLAYAWRKKARPGARDG